MSQYDFEGKYKYANLVSRWLVNNFFQGIDDLARLARPQSCLEVGCGAGHSTQRLRTLLPDKVTLESLDLEADLVSAAQNRNPGVKVTQQSIYSLDYPDNSFDVLFVLEVFEHLEDPAAALREVTRIAKKWLIASVPREPLWCALNMSRGKYLSDFGNTPGHIQHWSKPAFVKFLSKAGRVVEIRSPVPWTQCLVDLGAVSNP